MTKRRQAPAETGETTAEDLDLAASLRQAVEAAADRKAEEVKILDLAGLTDLTDYFVICSAGNQRQVQAISDGIEERLRQQGVRPLHIEGYPSARWVLMDYGDFVVHVFQEEQRRFYALEKLWLGAEDVTADVTSRGEEAGGAP